MKLLLVDGHYYVYRSFFAIRGLSNSQGEPTNAIYGFIKTIRRMLKDLQPDLAAVIWDEGLPERRTQLQPAYKQTRAEMPGEMVPQINYIQQKLTPLLGMPGLSSPNTEADDLMASYSCAALGAKYDVILATNDKDLFQLVEDGVKIYSTNKADLVSPKDAFALIDAACVEKKWGVPPRQIAEVLCLIGDNVDNIPGVPGLGPKNAAALLVAHHGLNNLLGNLESVKNERIREKLKAAREQIAQNREMVKLDTDLPLPLPLDELKVRPRYQELIAELERCEFKSLLEEVRAEASKCTTTKQGELF
jgi:5'-3' exonuclease